MIVLDIRLKNYVTFLSSSFPVAPWRYKPKPKLSVGGVCRCTQYESFALVVYAAKVPLYNEYRSKDRH